jgi:hypothetical protein
MTRPASSGFRALSGTGESWWVWQGERVVCGPFTTHESALATAWHLEDGVAEMPDAEPGAGDRE